jgi:hypothetical protein
MNSTVDLDEQQYAMLCGDVSLLSAAGRKDVWSALPVCGRWRLRPGEAEAAEMRILFLIRGMADAAAIIDKAVLAARHNPSLRFAGGSTALGVDGATEWGTLREDPFAVDWTGLRARLADVPALDATTLFAHLLRRPATSRRHQINPMR